MARTFIAPSKAKKHRTRKHTNSMEYTFQEMPDLQKTGERRVFPKAFHCDQISYAYFANEMAKSSGFSRGIIDGVLGEVVRSMESYLKLGHSVKIDGIGTFNIALGMKNREEAETVKEEGERYDTYNVYIRGINFIPDADWLRRLRRETELEKVGEVKTLRRTNTSLEERRQRALDYLSNHPFMRVMDYMALTGLGHSSATRELRLLRRDPNSGIKGVGTGNQLVYILHSTSNI